MTKTLTHRGPDDRGEWCNEAVGVALGSCRLSIIDLSPAGRQPIFNEDGTVALAYNGEVYNFLTLRQELLDRGHRFRSRTDSEVIVHGYEEFGVDIFRRLDGMFALALWDGRGRKLLLARDRVGKKPLYYYASDGLVVFGSEIKCLLAHPGVPVEVDPTALPSYLVHGYVQWPYTSYRHIFQVPPATWVVVDRSGIQGQHTFWELKFPEAGEERKISEAEAAENLRGLVHDAVRKRLISDVPLGALLSGGLDSSVVVGAMTNGSNNMVRTFTVGFSDEDSYDERPFARSVAAKFGTAHAEFVVNPASEDLLDDLLWYHDQPYADSSSLPTFLVCRMARNAVTVALGGDGGDEIFGGYERFRAALLAERVPAIATALIGAVLRQLPSGRGYHSRLTRLRRFGMGVDKPLARRYLEWVSVIPPRVVSELLANSDGVAAVEAQVETIMSEVADAHPLHRLMYFNLKTYLPGDLLVKMDRMSMANSMEIRSPLLDTALLEFTASLPTAFKVRGGEQKILLRRAFADRLPQEVLARPKHGFGVPLDAWFRGPLRSRVMDELIAPDCRLQSYLRQEAVRRLVVEHLSGRGNHGQRLWVLLNLEMWLRQLPRWPRYAGRNG
jgi:asparagine synthase (glutamine-hydrolysing)